MQIFHRSANAIAKGSIVGAIALVGLLGWLVYQFNRSPYVTMQGVHVEQPVPFSHQHHVAGLGIDCRYCHTSVEDSSFAGIPPIATCMNCHAQIWTNAPMLEPIREAYRSGVPVQWERVHRMADFVQFNHSIHVAKGIGCASCHGSVDKMQLMYQDSPMTMQWCLECHRNPEKHVRPRERVFDMTWKAEDQKTLGAQLVKEYRIQSKTNCSVCHY
jgi:hypothetical protein